MSKYRRPRVIGIVNEKDRVIAIYDTGMRESFRIDMIMRDYLMMSMVEFFDKYEFCWDPTEVQRQEFNKMNDF